MQVGILVLLHKGLSDGEEYLLFPVGLKLPVREAERLCGSDHNKPAERAQRLRLNCER